jgi:hypothetical protein
MPSLISRGEKAVNLVLPRVIFLPAKIGSLISKGNEILHAATFLLHIHAPNQLVH